MYNKKYNLDINYIVYFSQADVEKYLLSTNDQNRNYRSN